jgi:hypothetical protein
MNYEMLWGGRYFDPTRVRAVSGSSVEVSELNIVGTYLAQYGYDDDVAYLDLEIIRFTSLEAVNTQLTINPVLIDNTLHPDEELARGVLSQRFRGNAPSVTACNGVEGRAFRGRRK